MKRLSFLTPVLILILAHLVIFAAIWIVQDIRGASSIHEPLVYIGTPSLILGNILIFRRLGAQKNNVKNLSTSYIIFADVLIITVAAIIFYIYFVEHLSFGLLEFTF